MKWIPGRVCSISLAFIIALSALFPMVGVGTLSSPQYVPMQPGDFNLYKSDHFDIYYDSSRITDVSDVVMDAEASYDKATAFFGPSDYRVRIILAANHLQYTDVLHMDGLPESDAAGNWGDGDRGTIVIEAPDQLQDFRTVLTYQLAQVEMRTRLIDNKYSMPDWFSRGLADYVSGSISDKSRAMATEASRDNKLMTVSQIENTLEHSTDSSLSASDLSLADAQSGLVFEYTAEKYGNDSIKLILQSFGSSGNLDKAFTSSIGYSPESVNAEWEAGLKATQSAVDRQEIAQRVYGYVLDPDGKPVANEAISFISMRNDSPDFGKAYTATTDKAGYYLLNLTYGPFNVHAEADGYQPVNGTITLARDEVRQYNITLASADATKPPDDTPVSTSGADRGAIYAVLGVANAAAILFLAFVFLRTRK